MSLNVLESSSSAKGLLLRIEADIEVSNIVDLDISGQTVSFQAVRD